MIEFAFFINGNFVDSVQAVRTSGNPGQVCTYDVTYQDIKFQVQHYYDDGAWKLMEIVAKQIAKRKAWEDDTEQNKD